MEILITSKAFIPPLPVQQNRNALIAGQAHDLVLGIKRRVGRGFIIGVNKPG